MYNYLNKWYHVILKHKTDAGAPTQRLSFRLIDTPVTALWLETVRETVADPNFKIYRNQFATFIPTLEKIQATWNKLYRGVQEVNSKQWIDVDYISMPEQFDPNSNSRALLNQLHYEFHKSEETMLNEHWRIIDSSYDPLLLVNTEIHKLELMITSNTPLFLIFAIHKLEFSSNDGKPLFVRRPIPTELYQYWNHGVTDGVLLLGYHTVGKNLFHCYWDNDINLVKMNMVRPQVMLGTETQMYFSVWPVVNQQPYLERMHQWVKDNDLESYVNSYEPQHNLSQQPMLGKIQNNLSRQEISDFFEYYQVAAVELEE